MENLEIFGTIGNTLGYSAMLLVFWMYNKIKDMEKRLESGDSAFKQMNSKIDNMNETLHELIGEIRADRRKKDEK